MVSQSGKKRIIVLVGPSGSGKTTVGEALTQLGIPKLVTTTTRQLRVGEQDSVDYYFRNAEDMDTDDFVEQTVYNGRVYGLTKNEVDTALDEHDLVHVSLDKNGARAMKENYPEETLIFFIYVSIEEMVRRMQMRGDSEDKISERVRFSQQTDELKPLNKCDLVIENVTVAKTVESIMSFIEESSAAVNKEV